MAEASDTGISLLEFVTDGLVVIGASWRIERMNRSAETLLGMSRAEWVGRPLQEAGVPEERMRVYERVMSSRQPERVERVTMPGRRGERIFEGEVLPTGEGGICILFREATEWERMQEEARALARQLQERSTDLEDQASELEMLNEELSASEARLRAVINSALDAVITTDDRSVILDWSRQAESLFGWSAEEAVGRTLGETIIPPEHRDAHTNGVDRYLRTGEPHILNRRIEIAARHRDGATFPVELTVASGHWGHRVVFTAFLRDIRERKRAEMLDGARFSVARVLAEAATLEEAQPRLLTALSESLGWAGAALWGVDPTERILRLQSFQSTREPPLTALSQASVRLTFEPGVGLPGRVWAEERPLWLPELRSVPNFPRAAAAEMDGIDSALAFPLLLGSEVLGVIELFSSAPADPDAELLRTLGDVGSGQIGQFMARRRAHEEVQRLNRDLQRRVDELAEATRAKDRFLATMSHELRTPLNAILGYAELLDSGISGEMTPTQRNQVSRIRSSGAHLLDLINDVLDVVRADAGRLEVELEPHRIAESVEDALGLVRPQAESKGLELRVVPPDEPLPPVLTDPRRLRQILVNLLSNAVKFTDAGWVELRVARVGEMARVEVHDSGIGIPAEKLSMLFSEFFQAEDDLTRRYGGSGLGLAISRRLARLMGGEVEASSEPGGGSTFTLSLPIAPGVVEHESWPRGGWSAVEAGLPSMEPVGAALASTIEPTVERLRARLREDPATPRAKRTDAALLDDHLPSLLGDIAHSVGVVGGRTGQQRLFRDGTEIQGVIAALHGAQRARLGWSVDALAREFEIMREETRASLHAQGVRDAEGLELVDRLLERAGEVSLRRFAEEKELGG